MQTILHHGNGFVQPHTDDWTDWREQSKQSPTIRKQLELSCPSSGSPPNAGPGSSMLMLSVAMATVNWIDCDVLLYLSEFVFVKVVFG